MKKIKLFFFTLISLSLIFGNISVSYAKIKSKETNSQLYRFEQPLQFKILVTLGGIGLIGTEVWWFLFSKIKTKKK
ncbi:MAG: cupredoxin domain-containing protein, partial [cyanobacterium endosymbiont of Rhopalodia inflata]